MSENNLILALDTSNYTTSVAIITEQGKLVANFKKMLTVKSGERGLRQSDALFAHTVNIPCLMNEARKYIEDGRIVAVGVSEKPRKQEGSYMPCFLAGVSAAEAASAALGVPVYKFSHQCGHIMAAIYSSGRSDALEQEFYAFHISGGTTELVRVIPDERGFQAEIIGGSRDISAGQLIDRIGVLMGLSFPAGKELEALALANREKISRRKVSRDGLWLNLSGVENIAQKMYRDSQNKEMVSAFVLDYLGRAFVEVTENLIEACGKKTIICAGGVMCNSIIKKMLSDRFDVSFAEPSMSCDNAVGVAELTRRAFLSEN